MIERPIPASPRAHRFEGVEAGHRPGPAVDPDGVDAGGREGGGGRTWGVVPSRRTSSSPNVIEATIGRSAALRASSMREEQVVEVGERLDA